MSNHIHQAEPARRRDLQEMRSEAEAFALEQHDEEGRALPLDWVTHPGLVQQLSRELAIESFSPNGINHALTQRVYLRTRGGRVLRFHIADVRPGSNGLIILADGHVPASPKLQSTIGAAYGDLGYDSSLDRLRTFEAPLPISTFRVDPPEPSDDLTEIALYVYQDNEGATWNKEYAESHALAANTEAFGVNGLVSLLDELGRLRREKKVVRVLVFAAHGTQAVFRIGKESDPFNGPSYVGFYPSQVAPGAFAGALSAFLAKGAQMYLATCYTAGDGGTKSSSGSEMIQAMSDLAPARVVGSDGLVSIHGAQASTPGNLWAATPNEGSPKISTPAPAGNFNPPWV